MEEAISYYQRKLDKANDLTGIAYVHKLIQLGHQATIDKTLDGLKNVQYPRHFPNHLVVQLARLNRPDINENLIRYFKMHFKANNTEWHAISALQDDRVVDTVVGAINEYEKSYFSHKVVTRCIHLLGRIASHGAFLALKNIIDSYLETEHRFIDNYETPLASTALEALAKIKSPEAEQYLQSAQKIYQERIETELATYPARLDKERTSIGISLHEGSALMRMKQFALPTLVDWHRHHPAKQVRDFALTHIISTLKAKVNQADESAQIAMHYLLSLYDELKASNNLEPVLNLLKHYVDEAITPFARRVFLEGIANREALTVLAHQKADSVFEDVLDTFENLDETMIDSQLHSGMMKAYIHYFGQINHPESRSVLRAFYKQNIAHLQSSIAEAMANQVQYDEEALDFLNTIIDSETDAFTVKQTISFLPSIGERALLILLSLLECEDERQNYAVEALGLMRNPQAVPYLMETLLNSADNSALEELTVKALERIGTETCFAALNAWEKMSA